jgi:hypothetical protein
MFKEVEIQTDIGIRTLGIKRLLHKAEDKREWARIAREAKVKLKGS